MRDLHVDDAAVVVVDTDGEIRWWNRGAEALFGYGEADAVGQTLDLIVPDEFRSRHWTGFRRAVATGQANADGASARIPVLCRDGEVRRFAGPLSLPRGPGDQVIGAMGVWTAHFDGELFDLA